MSNVVSLHTALTGFRAAQTGLDTASHNVANAHTPGYTRQRVDLVSRSPYYAPVGPIGTGVDVAGIARTRDMFLDARVRTLSAEFGWFDTKRELLQRAEGVLAEPDHGISAQLGALWDAFENLAADPSDTTVRQQVVSALDAMAAQVRAVAKGWDQLAADGAGRLEGAVAQVNDLLAEVAELNRRIGDVRLRGDSPNDLYDRRDLALDRLASLAGATFTHEQDGSATVSLPSAGGAGSVVLVDGATARELSLDPDTLAVSVEDGGGVVALGGGGELFAVQEFVTTTLPELQAELDAFVVELIAALNGRHADGAAGAALLSHGPAGAARSLEVTAAVRADPRRLAAAAAEPVAAHDGRNADWLAALRTDKLGGGVRLDDRLKGQIVGLASAVANSRRAADTQGSLTVAATVARQSAHGVSLDEEMVAVVQYQRALEAISRVMTSVDQALDTLVNRTGVVGR